MFNMFETYMYGVAVKDAYLEAKRNDTGYTAETKCENTEDEWERYCEYCEELD